MDIRIDGEKIKSEKDFHQELALGLGVQGFYGCNLDALWDLLSASVERPITLRWENAQVSRENLGEIFEQIVGILERVKKQDENFGWKERFTYELE